MKSKKRIKGKFAQLNNGQIKKQNTYNGNKNPVYAILFTH
jgi:hypothetical protein